MTGRGAEAISLDARVGAAVVAASAGLSVVSHIASWPRLALVAFGLFPAGMLHVALTFPRISTLARFAPTTIGLGYLITLILAAFAARAAQGLEEARGVAEALIASLAVLSTVTLVVRLMRSRGVSPASAVRLSLFGGLVSVIALAAWIWLGAGRTALICSLAFPALLCVATWAAGRSPGMQPLAQAAPGREQISLDQVARGLAHAMLKPVSAVSQQLRLVAPRLADVSARVEIEEAAELMAQLQRLVRDVLDLARAQGEVSHRQVHVAKLVEQAVSEVRARFRDARIDVEAGEGSLAADEVAIRCLLVNLLENALEAAPAPGWVALRTEHTGTHVQLMVEDRSGGLPQEVQERLFEPFVTTKPRGTGLGLAVVREICRAHGGRVAAHAVPGGTRFIVTLPARPSS